MRGKASARAATVTKYFMLVKFWVEGCDRRERDEIVEAQKGFVAEFDESSLTTG